MTPQQRQDHIELVRTRNNAQRQFDKTTSQLSASLASTYSDAHAAMSHIIKTVIAEGHQAAIQMISEQPHAFGQLRHDLGADNLTSVAYAAQEFCQSTLALNQAQLNLSDFQERHLPEKSLQQNDQSIDQDMEPEQ